MKMFVSDCIFANVHKNLPKRPQDTVIPHILRKDCINTINFKMFSISRAPSFTNKIKMANVSTYNKVSKPCI